MKQGLHKLTTFKAALFAGLAALVLTTCTAAVADLPLASNTDDTRTEAGLNVATKDVANNDIAGDLAVSPAPAPPPAPADGFPSAPVEPTQPLGQTVFEQPSDPITFEKVTVQQPRLRVLGLADAKALRAIREIPGVRYAALLTVARVPVGERNTPITIGAIDPQKFRVLTPEVTANAGAVWQRIVEGDAAFTHDTGNRLKAELGGFVNVGNEGATLRVGAYASNGIPPVADALISPQKAQELGIQGRHDAIMSLREGADPAAVAQRVRRLANVDVQIIEEPQARRAYLTGADAKNAFEPFNYIDMGDGMIQIDPDWVRRNIVRKAVPILKGEVVCHRLMVDQLYGALAEIEARGLAHLIDPSQYGGCWVPRHIDFNPAKPLSMHGWGLAADFNVSTNGLGQKPTMDPRIVKIFERWGFVWGGYWSRPDGMHFELGALIQNSPQG